MGDRGDRPDTAEQGKALNAVGNGTESVKKRQPLSALKGDLARREFGRWQGLGGSRDHLLDIGEVVVQRADLRGYASSDRGNRAETAKQGEALDTIGDGANGVEEGQTLSAVKGNNLVDLRDSVVQ